MASDIENNVNNKVLGLDKEKPAKAGFSCISIS